MEKRAPEGTGQSGQGQNGEEVALGKEGHLTSPNL